MPYHVYVAFESVHGEADCFSCIVFLARALLSSRCGLQRSDSVVNHLVRNVIQVGLFAMVWAFAELGTYFLLPERDVYTVFDMTSGLIYTHVSDCFVQARCRIFTQKGVQMIYDGLLSRPRLRTRLAQRSQLLEVGLPSQVGYSTYIQGHLWNDYDSRPQLQSHPSTVHNSGGKRLSETARGRGTVPLVNMADLTAGTQNESDVSGIGQDIESECESEHARKPVDDGSQLV